MIQAIRQMIALFDPGQRRAALALVSLMFGAMLMETLGIGMVIPALLLLTQGDLTGRFPMTSRMLAEAGFTGPQSLLFAGLAVLAGIYVVKCAYVSWVTWLQMRFCYRVQADLSRRLFVNYLYKPWTFHLQHNSSLLVKNVVNATNELTMTGLVSLLILATEIMVLGGISLLLLYVEPVGALVAASFLSLFGFVLNHATRSGIRRAGEERQVHEEMRIRYLQQAMGGVKELKLLSREQGLVALYTPHNEASAKIGRNQTTLLALPKLWLELLAVLGLVLLVLVLVWQGKPATGLVPTLGLFAAAAFRLIPSMNRILGSVQFIRHSGPVIEALHSELAGQPEPQAPAPPTPLPFERELAVRGISIRYPAVAAPVIADASFAIERGTTVGFIGGSGAGKSTLVDALLGLLPLEAGRILADGTDISTDLRGWQVQVGYVPQSIYLTDDTIRRNVAFGLGEAQIDDAAVRRALAAAQLLETVEASPLGLETVVGEHGVRLSGGQRQRIGIARALYHNPSLLVLDEATSSLDTATENDVMEAIDALHGSKTILIVTHRTNTLRHCDRVYRVGDGAVTAIERLGPAS